MSSISNDQLDDFCTKLEGFKGTLSQPQRDLLEAILKIAWTATEPEESIATEFDGCFKPKHAELILAYGPGGPVTMVPRLIRGLITGP